MSPIRLNSGTAMPATLLTLALLLCGTTSTSAGWEELGPAPILSVDYTGRVSAVACSPTDPDRYFAAGADGGIWRTSDGGATWTPLTEHLPTLAMGALAIDPNNESIIYGGSGEANFANHSRYGLGLYKSVDGGDTWEVLAADTFAGRCFSRIIVNPQDSQQIFAAVTRAGGFPELAAAKGHPGATGPVGVFRSNDAGQTWTQLTSGLPNLSATELALDPTDPTILYAAIGRIFGDDQNGIYKTTDGGDSWTKLAGGLPTTNVGRISVAVAPSLPDRVYALLTEAATEAGGSAEMHGAYRSDDGGGSWFRLDDLAADLQATYGWYLSTIGVHPTNPDLVVMGGVTMYASMDAGVTWSNRTPPHVDIHAACWDAAGRLVVGDDGGVHVSADGNGTGWVAANGGLGVIQCYAGLSPRPTDDRFIIVGTQDNGTNRRSTGTFWFQRLGGDGGWTQWAPDDIRYVFAEFQGTGNLYRSDTGGGSFTFTGNGINSGDRNAFLPPYLINPQNPLEMLYATHRIYRSTDRGANWSPISADLTAGGAAAVRALAYAPSDPTTVYAATNDGRVLVSGDGGETFDVILTDVPGWPRITRELRVDPSDPDHVLLAVGYFGVEQVRRSRDRGQTWETLDGDLPDVPVNVVEVDWRTGDSVIYAGTDIGVYRTINGGESWHRYGASFPNAAVVDLVLQVETSPAFDRLIVATQGRGIWLRDVAVPGDMNGDGAVNGFDIDPFVLGLTDPTEFAAQFPTVDLIEVGDMNGDDAFDGFDIDGLVRILTGS